MKKDEEKLKSQTSKIIIRKQISLSFNLTSYVFLFLTLIICLNFGGILYSIDTLSDIKNDVLRLDERMERVEEQNSSLYIEEEVNNYYRELSDKTDEAIDRILTIVGLLATVTTFFGVLLAFKAPRDIEKKMEENKVLLEKAEKAAKDAKYQAEIIEALNVDYDGRLTNSKRIQKISKVIKRYPEEPEAYLHRGFVYDQMAQNEFGAKKKVLINLAISDYEIAHKLGIGESSYYNDIGIAYSRLGEYQKAIWCYTKAIEKEPDNAASYINRGGDYESIGEYQKSLDDLETALKLNLECYDAYVTRSYTYQSLWRRETNPEERDKFIKLQIADLKRAIDIDPEENKSKELLEELINQLNRKGLMDSLEI